MTVLKNRYEILLMFDAKDSNPNGDPDGANLPRVDATTGLGLTTDVCLKRKVRNFVEMWKGDEPGYGIFVTEGAALNEKSRLAYFDARPGEKDKVAKAKKLEPKSVMEAKALNSFMCENFYDVRTFGAVMGTGINAGTTRGPVQISFARSIEPIIPVSHTITRMAKTNVDEKAPGEGDEMDRMMSMGRKPMVPYALYAAQGFVSAKLAARTGFSEDDMEVLVRALKDMFEHDRSASRPGVNARKVILFKHTDPEGLGNAHAQDLFDLVKVWRVVDGERVKPDVKGEGNLPPAASFCDYEITIDRDGLPAGVEIVEVL